MEVLQRLLYTKMLPSVSSVWHCRHKFEKMRASYEIQYGVQIWLPYHEIYHILIMMQHNPI